MSANTPSVVAGAITQEVKRKKFKAYRLLESTITRMERLKHYTGRPFTTQVTIALERYLVEEEAKLGLGQ